jgi:beta-glucosidase
VVNYPEGIYVGYRWFDKKKIEPLFPFGFGLSYTEFKYKDLKLSQNTLDPQGNVSVTLEVANTGKRAGEEVVQLYVHDRKPQIDKPVRELKGFAKISLAPGESKPVAFTLTPRDFAYFDVPNKQWRADAGEYEIEIGASSRDIRLDHSLLLTRQWVESVPGSQESPLAPAMPSQ